MNIYWSESRHERREERDGVKDEDMAVNGVEESSKHSRKKSSRGDGEGS